jgi:hypothetical protein
MYTKKIKYNDFNGTEREEEFFFNLTKAELLEMELMQGGGMENYITRIIAEQDQGKIMQMFKEIILKAYGEKSLDGKRFVKSEEISTAFTQTGAYDVLFVELATDADAASTFINAVIPEEIVQELATGQNKPQVKGTLPNADPYEEKVVPLVSEQLKASKETTETTEA